MIFYLSTRTFSSTFSIWLEAQILALLHLHVGAATFNLLQYLMRRSAHLTVYGIFAVFIYHSLAGEKRPAWSFRRAVLSVLIAGLYSLTDEFHQSFVPGRSASLLDCGVDTVGAILGTILVYLSRGLLVPKGPSPSPAPAEIK